MMVSASWTSETARREAFSDAGLEGWEFDMLSALRRSAEDALSPGALMHETLVTSGTMTTRIDKLVTRGLVSKNRSPHDGRAVEVVEAREPVLRIEGTFESAVMLETVVLSILNHDSGVASVGSRMVTAARGRPLIEMGGRRVHEDAAIAAAKAAVDSGVLEGGIMHALVTHNKRFVLVGSVRDDGPLPDVYTDVIEG